MNLIIIKKKWIKQGTVIIDKVRWEVWVENDESSLVINTLILLC